MPTSVHPLMPSAPADKAGLFQANKTGTTTRSGSTSFLDVLGRAGKAKPRTEPPRSENATPAKKSSRPGKSRRAAKGERRRNEQTDEAESTDEAGEGQPTDAAPVTDETAGREQSEQLVAMPDASKDKTPAAPDDADIENAAASGQAVADQTPVSKEAAKVEEKEALPGRDKTQPLTARAAHVPRQPEGEADASPDAKATPESALPPEIANTADQGPRDPVQQQGDPEHRAGVSALPSVAAIRVSLSKVTPDGQTSESAPVSQTPGASAATVPSNLATGTGALGQDLESKLAAIDPAPKRGEKIADADVRPEVPFAAEGPASKPGVRAHDVAPAAKPEPPPEARFAELNHEKVVTGIRAELLPNGGSMNIRLDPPELGDLRIAIQVRDGVITAGFQTSNEQATNLLSHSLSDLKSVLESHGISVDRLHVQQAPKDPTPDANARGQENPTADDQQSARREQQRKEMVQRMWDKLMKGSAPVDVLA